MMAHIFNPNTCRCESSGSLPAEILKERHRENISCNDSFDANDLRFVSQP
ncbi:hypothetical protein DC522_21750 [Microvirga sp. KLBC 81]|nr:hypothetical protein DC522_21750 [Microvirga sp. KLBC 81]